MAPSVPAGVSEPEAVSAALAEAADAAAAVKVGAMYPGGRVLAASAAVAAAAWADVVASVCAAPVPVGVGRCMPADVGAA
jgi:hypothetical protein